MSISRGNDDLIAAIYDAIIDPSRWDEVVKRIVEATKSMSGGLLVRSADAAHLSASHNIDPYFASAYVQTWYNQSPLDTIASTNRSGQPRDSHAHHSNQISFRSSAYYNEMRRPRGWADVVAVGLVPLSPRNIRGFGGPEIVRCNLGGTRGMEPLGNYRAAFKAGSRGP